MNAPIRSLVPDRPFHSEELAPGVTLRRFYPGGKEGPDGIVLSDIPGGQTWSENFILGDEADDFMMLVPDIRMPPNQLWPMHWHDCWTIVLVLEGKCLLGDWYMEPGDIFVAAPSIEYGPLLIGPMGCRLLEIFGDLSLAPGGYDPVYHDHPTLRGGSHVFKERQGPNTRNAGNSSLPLDGVEGIFKARLEPGWRWDLGDPADPERPVVRYTELAPGESLPARTPGDWYGALLLGGSVEASGRELITDDALVVRRGAAMPALVAGKDGAKILEHFRTTRAL